MTNNKNKKTPNNKNKIKSSSNKGNKKLIWIYTAIFAVIFAVTAGLTAWAIPDRSDPVPRDDPSLLPNQIPNSEAHNIKQRFFATFAMDAMTGLKMSEINADINVKTPTKLEDGELKPVEQHIKITNGYGEMRMPSNMPSDDPGPMKDNYFKFVIPLTYENARVVTFTAELFQEVVYLDVVDTSFNGKKVNFKYKASLVKEPVLDENGNKTLIRLYPLYYKSVSELDRVLHTVTRLINQYKIDSNTKEGEEPKEYDATKEAKWINYQAILDGMWYCTCISNGPNNGYSFYPVIPVGYMNEKPLFTIHCAIHTNPEYHMKDFEFPGYAPTLDSKEYFEVPFFKEFADTKVKFSLKSKGEHITRDEMLKQKPANPNSYLSVINSLNIFEKLYPMFKQPKLAFNVDGDIKHIIGVNPITKITETESAKFELRGGCDFGLKGKNYININSRPQYAYFGGKLTAEDKENKPVSQTLDVNYQDEKFFLNYSDQLKLRMSKNSFDKLLGQFIDEFSEQLPQDFKLDFAKVEESLKSITGLGISRTINSLIDTVGTILNTGTLQSLSGGTFEKMIPFIDNVTSQDNKVICAITLKPIGLEGKIIVEVSNDKFISVLVEEVKFGDFTINSHLSSRGFDENQMLPDVIPSEKEHEYYNLKEVSGVVGQMANLLATKEAGVDANITLRNYNNPQGPRIILDASGDMDLNKRIATGNAVLKQHARVNGQMVESDFNVGVDVIDTLDNRGVRIPEESNVFMKFNSYRVEGNKPVYRENAKPLKGYIGIQDILDTFDLFSCAGSQNDPRFTRIMRWFSVRTMDTYLGAVINQNKLNGLITTLPLVGVNVGEISTTGEDGAVAGDTKLCLTVNKDVLGSDKNVRFDFLINDKGIKSVNTKYKILSPKGSNLQDRELLMKLDFTRGYKSVEENWKVTKDDVNVEKTSLNKLNKNAVINNGDALHDINDKELINLNSFTKLIKYGVNTALFGSGAKFERIGGKYVSTADKLGPSTYHVKLTVPSLNIGSNINVDNIIPNLRFEGYLKLDGNKVRAYAKVRVPVIPYFANPNFKNGVSLNNYIETEILYVNDSSSTNIESYEPFDTGTIYMKRVCSYAQKDFVDYRKVKGIKFIAHLGEWLDQYLLNDYIDHSNVYPDIGMHHRQDENNSSILPFFVDDLIDHNSFNYIDDASKPQWECAINMAKLFPSIYSNEAFKQFESLDKVGINITASKECDVIEKCTFSISSHVVVGIELKGDISLLNIKDDKYVECWSEIENRFGKLYDYVENNVESYDSPYMENTYSTERDGKTQMRDGSTKTIINIKTKTAETTAN